MSDEKLEFEEAARQWWAQMSDRRSSEGRQARAQIRRCQRLTEVAFVPYFHRLVWSCPGVPLQTLAAVAAVLAHVESNDEKISAATQMGAAVSDKRFRRLLAVEEGEVEELMRQMVRLVSMLRRSANVPDLARAVRTWGDATRQRWAFDFYAVQAEEKLDKRD